MTESSILTKIRRELDRDLAEECQVVYILAEIRKFVERTGDIDNYYALDFHCSLALHTTMSRTGAQQIVQRFDKAYPFLVRNERLPEDIDREIGDTIRLKKFREQLTEFLAVNNLLPCRMFPGSPEPWVKFIHLYGKVVDECDLELKGGGSVERVSIHLELPIQIPGPEWGGEVLFAIRWTCHGTDGKSGDHWVYFGYSPEREARDREQTA